jgi:hypothetical protein
MAQGSPSSGMPQLRSERYPYHHASCAIRGGRYVQYESETNFIHLFLSPNAQLFACCEERMFVVLVVLDIGDRAI